PKPLRMHTTELGDHLLRQAVAQVFLPRIPGEVLEGQHRQHDLVAGRDRVSCESEPGEVPAREQGNNEADGRDPETSGAAPRARSRHAGWYLLHRGNEAVAPAGPGLDVARI